jgi:hypothetical protein
MTEPARHLSIVRPDLRSPLRRALDEPTWLRGHVTKLTDQVGGLELLEALDAMPATRDVPVTWDGLAPDFARLLDDSVALAAAACDVLLDAECGELVRRLLTRAMIASPKLTGVSAERLAAAAVWVIANGNGRFGRKRTNRKASDVWAWFGVPASADLGRRLRHNAGIVDGDITRLPDPTLLHSAVRRRLIAERDRVERFVLLQFADREFRRPLNLTADGLGRWPAYGVLLWCRHIVLANGTPAVELGISRESGDVDITVMSTSAAIDLRDSLDSAIQEAFWSPDLPPGL